MSNKSSLISVIKSTDVIPASEARRESFLKKIPDKPE
jgi:hypothetical protein